jgi:hypothetical protein
MFLTNNNCYKAGLQLDLKGIMVHSTGADNPSLKRYVQPDDGKLGRNSNNNDWNRAKPGNRNVCVHAFIGLLSDGVTVATYQTLPWNMRGWHGGKKAANDNYIGFEICEDGDPKNGGYDNNYFQKVYQEAVELSAGLCAKFGISPDSQTLIDHSEGYKKGIASNHSDVAHWFNVFGKSMNTFRTDVQQLLNDADKMQGINI